MGHCPQVPPLNPPLTYLKPKILLLACVEIVEFKISFNFYFYIFIKTTLSMGIPLVFHYAEKHFI